MIAVPGKVMNMRVYVYNPVLGDDETITALIVWDALTPEEAGGVVNYYSVSIREVGTVEEIVVSTNHLYIQYMYMYSTAHANLNVSKKKLASK